MDYCNVGATLVKGGGGGGGGGVVSGATELPLSPDRA